MRVSLLSQKEQKKQFRISRELFLKNKQIVFAFGALVTVIFLYFGLSFYEKLLDKSIAIIVDEVGRISKERNISTEEEVLKFNSKLVTINSILNEHFFSSKLFPFIEGIAHPKVYFTNFTFSTNDSFVALNGSAENYTSFGEQYIALEQNKNISDLKLSKVTFSKIGKVEFTIAFKVNEAVYR